MLAVRGDMRMAPSSLPALSRLKASGGNSLAAKRPIEHRLAHDEALARQRRFQVEGQRLAGKMHERALLRVATLPRPTWQAPRPFQALP